MAKLRTQKKSRIEQTAIPGSANLAEELVNVASLYITKWKRQELELLLTNRDNNKLPVCIPINDQGYVVGIHVIKKIATNIWHLFNRNSTLLHIFDSKLTAVAYSLCIQRSHPQLAKRLLTCDGVINNCQQKLESYQCSIRSARLKRDFWRLDLFTILAEAIEFQLEDANTDLQEILRLTKHFRIWE